MTLPGEGPTSGGSSPAPRQPQGSPRQPPGIPQSSDKRGRGRPSRNYKAEVDALAKEFISAQRDCRFHWRDEQQTTLGIYKKLIHGMQKRIAVCTTPALQAESLILQASLKRLSGVLAFIEVIVKHGPDSAEFAKVAEQFEISRHVEPTCEDILPAHLRWSRSRGRINGNRDNPSEWLRLISCEGLAEHGISDISVEQSSFLAEYLATAYKLPEYSQCRETLTMLFGTLDGDRKKQCKKVLHADLHEVVSSITVLNTTAFSDLGFEEEVLTYAIECLEDQVVLLVGVARSR